MIAYKGFTNRLTARLGNGEYQFTLGETVEEDRSKTVSCGFHCTENPFECLSYYPLYGDNRYCQVEASGSIDEDDAERIACTRMTLLKELSIKELAGYGMMYMVQHPLRTKWQQSTGGALVKADVAAAGENIYIAIARGAAPRVKGRKGSVLGLIIEPEPGVITGAKLFIAGEDAKENAWYTLTENRELEECHETEDC